MVTLIVSRTRACVPPQGPKVGQGPFFLAKNWSKIIMLWLRDAFSLFVVTCVTLVVLVIAILVANVLAQSYLRAHPDVLLSRAERINENTRSVREAMIPQNKITEWYDLDNPDELGRMWAEFYGAGAIFESYVHYRSRPLVGEYYGMTEEGFRMVRNQGPWPPVDENINIFFFGGSTSFGVGPYWATVASYLQEELNQSRPGKFGQGVKWISGLRAARMPQDQEEP